MTEKKNQHYVPKFYLRNFSYQNNKKQIGVFNIKNNFYYPTSKLKTQGSKNFFYGCDGKIEEGLSEIEGYLSKTINNILIKKEVPGVNSNGHFDLRLFIALTDLRNPTRVENMKTIIEDVKNNLLLSEPDIDLSRFVPSYSHEDIIKSLLSKSFEMADVIADLDFKLLINKTHLPFISSDFPVVKYNQFLENAKWNHSKVGYGIVGLQIFVPLNSELTLIFFDSNIYKVGDRKKKYLDITVEHDINAINLLQFTNCYETVFFNELANEAYIRMIAKLSSNFKRANIIHNTMTYLIKEGEDKKEIVTGKPNLMIFGSSNSNSQLKLNGIKLNQKGKNYIFENSVIQERRHSKFLRQNKKA